MQLAYLFKVFFYKVFKLLHVNCFKNQIVEKNDFNIYLFNFSIQKHNNDKKSFVICEFNYDSKHFNVI